MTTARIRPTIADAVVVTVDASGSLTPELTRSVLAVAHAAEDTATTSSAGRTVVVLHVVGSGENRAPWPGPAAVGDVSKWENALRRLERAPAPVVASVRGDAHGAAAELMLAADYRIISDSSAFELATGVDGVWPSMALHRLVTHLGVAAARSIVLRNRPIVGQEAFAKGIVDAAVPVTEQDSAIETAVELFSGVTGSEFAIRRRLLFDAVTTEFEDSLGAHLAAADRMLRRSPGRDA